MKSLILMSSAYPMLLAIFAGIFSTSFQNPNELSSKEGCSISIQKSTRYAYTRKQVDGRAFPTDAELNHTILLDRMVDGSLEVCVDAKGSCQWKFSAGGGGKSKELALEIQGMEAVIRTLLLSKDKDAPDINRFLLEAKSKGASLQELGNGTISVTVKDGPSKNTSITLVDVRHNTMLGSSVYRDADGALLSKLVCMPMPNNRLNLSLYIFEHQLGEKSGWVTEIQCETSI